MKFEYVNVFGKGCEEEVKTMKSSLDVDSLEAEIQRLEIQRLKKDLEAAIAENATLQSGIEDVRYLIENSDGVCGLRLARDAVTPWMELRHDGPLSEWLENFDKADTI